MRTTPIPSRRPTDEADFQRPLVPAAGSVDVTRDAPTVLT